MVIDMKVRIKSVVKIVSIEELIVIPMSRNGDFVEALNFYEDVPGGRAGRLVVIHDKYGEISDEPVVIAIRGEKAYIEAKNIEEDFDKIRRVIPLEKVVKGNVVPFYVNIQVLKEVDTNSRGVRGFVNYLSKYGNVNFSVLKGIVSLEELV